MTHASARLGTILAILLVLANVRVLPGQVVLDGDHIRDATPNGVRQTVLIYKPAADDTPVLYFRPFFLFDADEDGILNVRVFKPAPGNTKWLVRLKLIPNPAEVMPLVARNVRTWAATESPDSNYRKYAVVDAGSFVPTEVTEFQVRQVAERDESLVFDSISRDGVSGLEAIDLTAAFATEDEALAFQQDLQAGRTSARFEIRYRPYARMLLSRSVARAVSVDLSQMDGTQEVLGAGLPFKLKADERLLAQGDPERVLTRDQIQRLRAELLREIGVGWTIENEADVELLTAQVDQWLAEVAKSEDRSIENIDAFLGHLSDYGFDPHDIKPDEIQKLMADIKEYLSTEQMDKFSLKAGASASFCGFGGSANMEMTREELKKHLEDRGWKIETEGTAYVPKSINVHVLQTQEIKKEKIINVSISRAERGTPAFTGQVSTSDCVPSDGELRRMLDPAIHDLLVQRSTLLERRAKSLLSHQTLIEDIGAQIVQAGADALQSKDRAVSAMQFITFVDSLRSWSDHMKAINWGDWGRLLELRDGWIPGPADEDNPAGGTRQEKLTREKDALQVHNERFSTKIDDIAKLVNRIDEVHAAQQQEIDALDTEIQEKTDEIDRLMRGRPHDETDQADSQDALQRESEAP
jgi:hypothetical protein